MSAIQDKDILSGVLSAGFREALSPLTANSSEKTQLLASQLGGLAGGEEGATNGYITSISSSTSNNIIGRISHHRESAKIRFR